MQLNPKECPNMQELIKLANTPAGKTLMELLQKQDRNQLYQAARKASQGDSKDFELAVQSLLSNPEIKAVLNEFEGM